METIVAVSSGINWNWYHWFEIEDNVAVETRADRWHKFENRGGPPEPETDWSFEFFERQYCAPDYWQTLLGKAKTDDADTIIYLRRKGEERYYRLASRA